MVASGDLTTGGRTPADGTGDFTNYDDAPPIRSPAPPLASKDPRAGLDQLAQQVKASGVTHVFGVVEHRP